MLWVVLWAVQVAPFKVSTKVNPAVAEYPPPTAVHAVGEVQDTNPREVDVAPAGCGVVWMVQAVPFQASASDIDVVDVWSLPTAVHAIGDVQDTAFK